jgi:hypothetical protein
MPRSPTVLTPPPGTLPFVPNTTIESGKANAVWLDLYQDGNTPRPIVYGGTGASNAADALNNLGAIGQSNYLAAFSIGDGFYSARDISAESGIWLKRDGSLYDSSTYPVLAALLPALPDGVEWSTDKTQIWRSDDGISYALSSVIDSFGAQDITFTSGVYIASGSGSDVLSKISYSSDGVSWSSPIATGVGTTSFQTVSNGTIYVTVGNDGKIATSTDLVSWSVQTVGSASYRSVKYINSVFVATGLAGAIATSGDGLSWTVRTSGVSDNLFDSTYGEGLYLVVGNSGRILTSTNLTTWTPRTSGTTLGFRGVTYSTSGFMSVGSGGVSRISGNGVAWTATPTGVSTELTKVIFDPDRQNDYYAIGVGTLIKGSRTLPTQFRVPNDAPLYGWIKAEND